MNDSKQSANEEWKTPVIGLVLLALLIMAGVAWQNRPATPTPLCLDKNAAQCQLDFKIWRNRTFGF